jgi:hypothetical protein
MVVAIEHRNRGVPMKMDGGKIRQAICAVGLVGACAFLLGPVVFGTAASSPNARRDVLIEFPSEATARVPTPGGHDSKETRTVSFVNRTDALEYPFQLDNTTEMVRLNLSVEVEHGLVRWELIDPAGVVRSDIRTTERARMDDTELSGMQGKWVLRMHFEDATGRYHIGWIR